MEKKKKKKENPLAPNKDYPWLPNFLIRDNMWEYDPDTVEGTPEEQEIQRKRWSDWGHNFDKDKKSRSK